MQKFLVLFLAPAAVMAEWMKLDPSVREADEAKMREDWNTWMAEHASFVKETTAAGKTKLVTAAGVTDSKNDLMLYSIVEAESHDAAAAAYVGHPHFGIPEATIEVMAIRPM